MAGRHRAGGPPASSKEDSDETRQRLVARRVVEGSMTTGDAQPIADGFLPIGGAYDRVPEPDAPVAARHHEWMEEQR
jgi:hypothetical protein